VTSASRTLNKGSKRLKLLLEIVFTVLLAILVARLIWLILAPGAVVPLDSSGGGPRLASTSTLQAEPADRSILVRSNPFVRSEEIAVEAVIEEDRSDAPETELNLRLTGIRALSGGEGSGSVWIVTPGGEETMVSVGEPIIDGVTLEQIYSDRVTIRTRGRLESLSRRDDEDSFLFADAGDQGGSTQASGVVPNAPARAGGGAVNAMALYNGMGFTRAIDDGTVKGYRLSPRGAGTTFSRAGFEDGDILLALNGRSVAQFENDDFIEFFLQQNRIEALVERGGVQVAIPLTFTEDT